MALRICLDCTAAYAVGLTNCPHCNSDRSIEQGEDPYRGDNMPHITRRGGPSNRYEIRGEHGPELVDPPGDDAPAIADAAELTEGGDEPSPGSSSQTSTPKPPATPGKSSKPRQSRARTTANRSRKAPTADSSAASTAGAQTDPESATAD